MSLDFTRMVIFAHVPLLSAMSRCGSFEVYLETVTETGLSTTAKRPSLWTKFDFCSYFVLTYARGQNT